MEEYASLADIKAHLDAQLARRAEQRLREPGGQAIAAQRNRRRRGVDTTAVGAIAGARPIQLHLSQPAHRGLVLMGVEANYVASADTQRAKGISDFIRDLVDPKGPAGRIEFEDTRPSELRDPDFLPGYAHPDRLNYQFWWTPRLDRESDTDHWRTQYLFKMSDTTLSHVIHLALLHEIAAPDRIHRTWEAVADYYAADPSAASTIHRHPLATSQAGAVLEVIGLGYLTPSCLPHSNKLRRYRRKQLTDLDFF